MRWSQVVLPGLLAAVAGAAPTVSQEAAPLELQVRQRLAAAPVGHPRLFLDAAGFDDLRRRLADDALLRGVRDTVLADAEAMPAVEPVRRELVGRRLLGVSRTCLKRVLYLAFAARITGEQRHAERAVAEMRAAAAFTDWNPSHFLDVAEMTAALAIGYDWLHEYLSADDQATIRGALVDLGLRPSLPGGWWVDTTNNWNQVCHAGLSLGALAIHEDEPELAARILTRAIRELPRAMGEYAPAGAYPEGPSYWNYGTGYNAVALSAFDSVLGTDFGLAAAAPGFLETPGYYQHVTGPTGLFFNYSDCGQTGGIAPAMYWFARRLERPGLLHHEAELLARHAAEAKPATGSELRLLPLALVWCPPLGELQPPTETVWWGQGRTPVALLRNGWSKDATYVGIKAGSPSSNHAHMDAGSFVIDALGTRWAEDLGSQNYHSLESQGISLWDRGQDGERWTVFRLSTAAHNVLMVEGQDQRVGGMARLERVVTAGDRPRALLDLGPVYRGQLATARRGVELLPDGSVRIQDEFAAPDSGDPEQRSRVRWAMLTRAEVQILEPRRAVLRRDGAEVELLLESPETAHWELVDTSTPRAKHDHANPGTRMLVFHSSLPAGTSEFASVVLAVAADPPAAPRPLSAW